MMVSMTWRLTEVINLRDTWLRGVKEVYHPTGHRILVVLDKVKEQTKTESGIEVVLDDKKYQEAHETATVIEMGPTCYNLPHHGGEPWCKVGDRVVIARYSGKDVPGDDTKLLRMVNDEDILLVAEEAGSEYEGLIKARIEQAQAEYQKRLNG